MQVSRSNAERLLLFQCRRGLSSKPVDGSHVPLIAHVPLLLISQCPHQEAGLIVWHGLLSSELNKL